MTYIIMRCYTMYPYQNSFIPRGIGSSLLNKGLSKSIPFSTPKAIANVATKTSKSFSLSSILSGAQKGINTLNQIIPLYNQVKPLVQNGKQMLNIFKNVKKTNFEPEGLNNENIVNKEEIKQEEIKDNIVKEEVKEDNNIIFNKSSPSKPFFV